MTIYNFQVISATGYPYYNLNIKSLPKEGIRLYLRFFDFTQIPDRSPEAYNGVKSFELLSGLTSALFEFAKNLEKKIRTLEFKSKREDVLEEFSLPKQKYEGEVLITTQTETYLLHKAVKEKVKLIYDNIISLKIPLETGDRIVKKEQQKIIDILTDATAREHVMQKKKEVRSLAEDFLREMGEYGLEGICITSFDLSPLMVLGEKYTFKDIEVILRNIGEIPEIPPLEWKYRQSFHKDRQVWVYMINSGMGVTVEGLFCPYFYLLFADPQSYLGEFPAKLTSEFNLIIGE